MHIASIENIYHYLQLETFFEHIYSIGLIIYITVFGTNIDIVKITNI